ncbi:MAG: DUF58 domain-containing protein [Gammaproteobacteria bacterium]|nr:DUF58 domain-containing protein [Gammaproteobacteria bacterium]MCY4211806.1 DUF58 domain-containing protein [Gammaproteobacteria bacterium]MCY4282900.1 DUF58 domain-containing protein [Gammaproteobacteria bacterium]MCY4338552.1 DUF58 domain-containing protein [Gammaproteobacteria bacterium]
MQVVSAASTTAPTRVSVPELVGLSRAAASLRLGRGRILSRRSGDYQSPFRGRGMEFDESRLYQPGDDVRNIDWRVTARTGKAHTKLFREERERPVFVWLDLRRPMHFATRGRYKSALAAQLGALVAWSALHNGDRVGGVIFSEQEHHELKPQRGKAAVLRLLNRIVHNPSWTASPSSAADTHSLEHALERLRRVARPGSLIFLISDFRFMDTQAEIPLTRLCQHNEVAMLFVHDRLEQELPPPGRYRLGDGARDFLVDSSDNRLSKQYRQRFQARLQRLQQLSTANRMLLIPCRTEAEPLSLLRGGLKPGRSIYNRLAAGA